MSIATVVSVIGNAWVRNPDGSLIELSEGMTLEAGQILITATDGLVELDLGEGELVYFAANQSLFLSSQMSSSAFVPAEQNTVASENIDLVLQALEEDGDLLEALDPTAAGPEEAGGTGIGARFTRVERVEPEAEEFVYNYSLNENDATFSTNPFPSNDVDAALESNATANNTPETVSPSNTTPPNAPVVSDVTNTTDASGNNTGTTVVGEAEPGNTVEIRDDSGNVVGSGSTDENGDFEVVVEPALADGEDYDVVAIDNAGNESATGTVNGGTVITGDTTAPDAPTVDSVTNNTDSEGNNTGTTVVGEAEPGTTVEIRDDSGNVVGSGTTDENGDFEVVVEPALEDGENYDVVAIDDAANESATGTVNGGTVITGDTTAPDAPTVDSVTNNTDSEGNNTGTTVVGEAEPGTTVEIRDEDGNVVGSGTTDEDGNFEIVVEPALEDGENYDVVATDDAGNESATGTENGGTVITGDTTAPDAPTVDSVTNNTDASGNNTGTTVVGEAEPGTTVEIRDDEGNVVGSGTTDAEGNYEVVVEPALADGEDYDVVAIDNAGNESATGTVNGGTVIVGDTTAPSTGDGQNSIGLVDGTVINGSNNTNVSLSGKVEQGGTVKSITITDSAGNTVTVDVDDITVNADGTVVTTGVDLSNLNDGTLTIDMSVTDAAGNTGNVESSALLDTTANASINITDVSQANAVAFVINGATESVEAGQVVSITISDSDASTTDIETTAVVQADGSYSTTVDLTSLTDGSIVVSVTTSDQAGNTATSDSTVQLDAVQASLSVAAEWANETLPLNEALAKDPTLRPSVATGHDKVILTSMGNLEAEDGRTYTVWRVINGTEEPITGTLSSVGNSGVSETLTVEPGTATFITSPASNTHKFSWDDGSLTKAAGNQTFSQSQLVETSDQALSVTGQTTDVAEGSTVSIVITDSNGNELHIESSVDASGYYELLNLDVSSLTDGPLTVASSASDNNGNLVQSNVTSIVLDTTNTTPSSSDVSYINTISGLKGEYWGYNDSGKDGPNLTNLELVKNFINGNTSDATFIAETINYGPIGNGDLGGTGNLEKFLGDDADSLSAIPGTSTDAIIRLTGQLELAAGSYQFKVTADDGYSIRINGEVVAEYNGTQSPKEKTHDWFELEGDGPHSVEILYFDQYGNAQLTVEFRPENGGYEYFGGNTGAFFTDYNNGLVTANTEALEIDSDTLLASASDASDDTLTISEVGNATGGTVSIDENGNVVFTPEAGFTGEATFTYTVTDGRPNGESTSTVTLFVTTEAAITEVSSSTVEGVNVVEALWSELESGDFGVTEHFVDTGSNDDAIDTPATEATRNLSITAIEGSNETHLLAVGDTYSLSWETLVNGEWTQSTMLGTVTRSDGHWANNTAEVRDVVVFSGTVEGQDVALIIDSKGLSASSSYYTNDKSSTTAGFSQYEVGGIASAGSQVEITDVAGNLLATTEADGSGQWAVLMASDVALNSTFTVTATDLLDTTSSATSTLIIGGVGEDNLLGTDGNDLVLGGFGDDILAGGLGADVFAWQLGDQGTVEKPAIDKVMDFNLDQGDSLSLADLLQGENTDNLSDYLRFHADGENTVIEVSHQGNGEVTQLIQLNGIELASLGSNDQEIITMLLDNGHLRIDQ